MNLYLKRLQKRFPNVDFSQYEEGSLTGVKYQELMSHILQDNNEKVSKRVAEISKNNFDEQIKRARGQFKALTPDVSEVLPKRSVSFKKSAEKGKGITNNLRDTLTKNLREVLQNPDYLRQTGKKAGTLKKDVVKEFEKTIRSTFENYSKRNPAYGVPTNIHNIAVTEVKSTVNTIKHEYTRALIDLNPDIDMVKVWIHNPSGIRIKNPREGHLMLDGTVVPMESHFVLHGGKGKIYRPLYPHDQSLPAEEIIGCSCEIQYRIRKKPPLPVTKSEEDDMIYKGLAPIGYISRRKDGDYKKISATEWELVKKNLNYVDPKAKKKESGSPDKITSETVPTPEQAKKAVELRVHAQEQLKKFPKEEHPNLYRGMMLSEDSIKELTSSGIIDMTGCSSLTFSNKVADQYSLKGYTATPESVKAKIPCKVIVKRDDDVDDSIGAWHKNSNDKNEKNPPYEVITRTPRLKADKVVFEKGMTPKDAIDKARENGDKKLFNEHDPKKSFDKLFGAGYKAMKKETQETR